MKFKRINLPEDENESQTIVKYLSEKFSKLASLQIKQSPEDQGDSEDVENATIESEIKIEDTPWALFLNFAMGTTDIAYYLAYYLIYNPDPTKDDSENNLLWMLPAAVADKLKDTKAKELIGDQSIPPKILNLADKCIVQIEKNKKETQGRDITYEEAIARAKNLDKIVGDDLVGHSFIKSTINENGTLTQYVSYVEPDNFSVEITGVAQ